VGPSLIDDVQAGNPRGPRNGCAASLSQRPDPGGHTSGPPPTIWPPTVSRSTRLPPMAPTARVVDLLVLRWCSDVSHRTSTAGEISARGRRRQVRAVHMPGLHHVAAPGPANTEALRFGRRACETVRLCESATVEIDVRQSLRIRRLGVRVPSGAPGHRASGLQECGPGASCRLCNVDDGCRGGCPLGVITVCDG
jgi:hypothetical protein